MQKKIGSLTKASKHVLAHLDTEVGDDETVDKHTPVNNHRLSGTARRYSCVGNNLRVVISRIKDPSQTND